MEKSKQKADAILTADWHLREDTPVCRVDADFQKTQWKKVSFISQLQKEHECPVLIAGDVFNHWKPSPWLLYKALKHLPDQCYAIYGNHDLPQHSLFFSNKSGLNVLIEAGKVTLLEGCHWGETPTTHSIEIKGRKILLWHKMAYTGQRPYPGCEDENATDMTNTIYKSGIKADLILTGHNHIPFTHSSFDTLLVNPGSIMRQSSDQIDLAPRVYLWYAKTNTVEPVYIPIEEGNVSREHLDKQIERDSRIDAFIQTLNSTNLDSLSFEKNLEVFMQQNDIRESVRTIIQKAIETNLPK